MVGDWYVLIDGFDGELVVVKVRSDRVGERASVGDVEVIMEINICE